MAIADLGRLDHGDCGHGARALISEHVNTRLSEVERERRHLNTLLHHLFKLCERTIVKLGVIVEERVFKVDWVVVSLCSHIEVHYGALSNTHSWILQSWSRCLLLCFLERTALQLSSS